MLVGRRIAETKSGKEGPVRQGAAARLLQEKFQGVGLDTSTDGGTVQHKISLPHQAAIAVQPRICDASNSRQVLSTQDMWTLDIAAACFSCMTLLCCLSGQPPVCAPQDYFEFESGNARAGTARGVSAESQQAIQKWLQENK